jgi:hypothetical protein
MFLASKFNSLDTVWAARGRVVDERIKTAQSGDLVRTGYREHQSGSGHTVCVKDGRDGANINSSTIVGPRAERSNVPCTGIEGDGEGDRENQLDDRLGKGECANFAGFGRHVRSLLRLCCF